MSSPFAIRRSEREQFRCFSFTFQETRGKNALRSCVRNDPIPSRKEVVRGISTRYKRIARKRSRTPTQITRRSTRGIRKKFCIIARARDKVCSCCGWKEGAPGSFLNMLVIRSTSPRWHSVKDKKRREGSMVKVSS